MGKILHASGSGLFPGCIGSGSPPPFGSPYLEMPLTIAMEFYWRVKTFKATWKIVFPPNPFDPTIPPFLEGELLVRQKYILQGTDENMPESLIPVAKEEDLVCAQQVVFKEEIFGPPVPPYPNGYGVVVESRILGKGPVPQFSQFENAQKHIQFNDFQRFFLASFTQLAWFYPTGGYNFDTRRGDFYVGDATIFGIKIKLYFESFGRPPEELPTANISWVPVEYWSYGETYNTGTGQLI